MQKLPVIPLILLLVLAFPLLAAAPDDLVFHATFDNTLVARNRAGTPINPLAGPVAPQYVAGRSGAGSALKTGGTDSHVNYPAANVLDLEAGTVSLWIKPEGWSTNEMSTGDPYLRHFFDVSGLPTADEPAPGYLSLYKNGASVYWLAWLRDPVEKPYYTVPGLTNAAESFFFRDGVWSHVIATWSGNQMSLFVDGTLRGTTYTPKPNVLKSLNTYFRIGGINQRGVGGTQDLVIDDVMVFREPFTPAEAAALYANQSVVTPRPEPKLTIDASGTFPSMFGNPAGARFSIVGRRRSEVAALTIDYSIKRKSDQAVVATGSVPAGELTKTHALNHSLPDGDYVLHASIRTPASAATPAEFKVRPSPSWINNGYGVGTTLPSGFEPVFSYALGATVTNRNYEWNMQALPAQITAAGNYLLTRPITLKATVNGTPYSMQTHSWRWVTRSSTAATYTADASLGPVTVTISGKLEFDGLIWSTITVSGNGHRVANLSLEIPMVPDSATLMTTRPFGNSNDIMLSGKVRAVSGALPMVPVMWVGNEDGGLQWSTNNVNDWKLANRNNALALIPGTSEVLTRLTFIDREHTLTTPLAYNLGLQATPVRNYPRDVRSWELNLNKIGHPSRQYWYFHYSQWNRLQQNADGPWGYAYEGPFMRADLDSHNAANAYLTLYNHTHALWTGDPVWETQGLEWRGKYTGPNTHPYVSVETSHESPLMRDYMLHMYRNLFTGFPNLKNQISGLYLDVVQAVWERDANPLNDDPKPSVFSILGTRELQKRLHNNLKAQSPTLKTINHQSGDPIMSQLAFADAMYTGEHLTHPKLVTDFGYMHILKPDAMRAEYYGRNLGVPMIFLPEFIRAAGDPSAETTRMRSSEGIAPTEHLVGLTWVHDVIVTNFYMHPDPIAQAGRAKAAFGWDGDTEFHPYWRGAADLLEIWPSVPAELYVSAYTREGKILFILHNNSPNAATISIRPRWNEIGFTQRPLIDAYLEQKIPAPSTSTLPMTSTGFTGMKIAPWSFKAIVIRD